MFHPFETESQFPLSRLINALNLFTHPLSVNIDASQKKPNNGYVHQLRSFFFSSQFYEPQKF
jgi:hypothetical protein